MTTTVVNALEIVDLSVAYGETVVVRDVSLRIPKGSVTALLGPNGAGKTTILRCVSGLVPARKGSISLSGEEVTNSSAAARARRGLCHVPEGRGIYPNLTVRENVVVQSLKGKERDSLDRVLEMFPRLRARVNLRAGLMSGGEQQMLALSAAFIRDPSLVVVDEVSLGLAPLIVEEMFEALNTIAQQGTSLLIVDQFVDRALAISTSVCVLSKGTIVFDGKPSELNDTKLFDFYSAGRSE